MEYRTLPHGGERIGVIGLGSSALTERAEAEKTVRTALDLGVNYIDMAAAEAEAFAVCGRAIAGRRDKVYLQLHFGADYSSGKYGWTTDPDAIKRSVAWQLKQLGTDYIDFGFIHCLDEESDLRDFEQGGTLEYMLRLKQSGMIRHIGLSTHTPGVAQKVLDMHIIDMLMFSINPAYDYRHGEFAYGGRDERAALYRRCAAEGVGISVMKAFSGGQLLDAAVSPFGQALTPWQCIQYALDRPGVLTVLPGMRSSRDAEQILGFFDATERQKDYSVLGTFAPAEADGKCVYCNHCQPCPAGLDIGLINKYSDLAAAGDGLARQHYLSLELKADDCIQCGHCDSRCPFHVRQSRKMQQIAEYFDKA